MFDIILKLELQGTGWHQNQLFQRDATFCGARSQIFGMAAWKQKNDTNAQHHINLPGYITHTWCPESEIHDTVRFVANCCWSFYCT